MLRLVDPRPPQRPAGAGERLQAAARGVWRRFFPPRVEIADEVREVLAAAYPALDLRRVSFHDGVPFYLDRVAFSQAIVLPAAFSFGRGRIYVQTRAWRRTDTVRGIGLLAHEAFHALQLQDSGPGLGMLRPFLVLYLACSAGNGFRYRRHPMEKDAYAMAGWDRGRFETALREADGPEGWRAKAESVAVRSSGLRFWRKLAMDTPGVPALAGLASGLAHTAPPLGFLVAFLPGALIVALALVWLASWTAATAVLTLLRGLLEGAAAVVAGALWATGAVVRLFERK